VWDRQGFFVTFRLHVASAGGVAIDQDVFAGLDDVDFDALVEEAE
jgi:hypothetical protein